jgi:predicted DNA-binding protein with PD1-like motif
VAFNTRSWPAPTPATIELLRERRERCAGNDRLPIGRQRRVILFLPIRLAGGTGAPDRALAAQVAAVGAFAGAMVGWFDRDGKDYRRIEPDEQVLSLIGDITSQNEDPAVHLRAVLGLSDGTVRRGHLLAGEVWPTLDVIVNESPDQVRKTSHPNIGLALIDLDGSSAAPS